jgi:nucleoside-diphosphate-sugar epimerase
MTGTAASGYEWSGRRVLVTGTGGFIGSQLAERLVELGADVRGFFRYTSGGGLGWIAHADAGVRNAIDPVLGDLRDADAVQDAVRGTDVVFHLGALIGIPYSYVHPRETFDTNVAGTLNVVTAARDHDLSLLVHTSTSETYGTATYVPIDEKHPLQAQSPYSATKIAADKLVESFHHSFAVPVTTVRPFNTYGPRQSPRAVIPTIASQALQGTTLALGHRGGVHSRRRGGGGRVHLQSRVGRGDQRRRSGGARGRDSREATACRARPEARPAGGERGRPARGGQHAST